MDCCNQSCYYYYLLLIFAFVLVIFNFSFAWVCCCNFIFTLLLKKKRKRKKIHVVQWRRKRCERVKKHTLKSSFQEETSHKSISQQHTDWKLWKAQGFRLRRILKVSEASGTTFSSEAFLFFWFFLFGRVWFLRISRNLVLL